MKGLVVGIVDGGYVILPGNDILVGLNVGFSVGIILGLIVGSVGVLEGILVGLLDAIVVASIDGIALRFDVGWICRWLPLGIT